MPATKPLTCISHRGGYPDDIGKQAHPENSLAAIRYSLALGVDAIEIDIWQIEGELIVTHDRRLGNNLPGQGLLVQQSLASIDAMRLGNGEKIPRLFDILKLIGDRCLLNIEIKSSNCVETLIECLTDFCESSGVSLHNYIVSSFDHRQLQQLQQRLPEVKRGLLISHIPLDTKALCQSLQAYSLHPYMGAIDAELVNEAHQQGTLVWVYTANNIDEWEYLQSIGVDGVFTDYPAMLQRFNND